MKDGNQKKSKVSWSKTLVRKWFNIKSKAHDFHADDAFAEVGDSERRKSFTERESCTIKRSKTERSTKRNLEIYRRPKFEFDGNAHVTEVQEYRLFVATWNVGAKSPPDHLSLDDWLHASPPADIYVLGFQEIVPLNAGNVLGAEDNGPAVKWLSLIRKTLNDLPGASGCGDYQMPSPIPDPIIELDSDFGGSTRQKAKSFFSRPSFHSLSRSLRMDNDISIDQPRIERRLSVCGRVMLSNRLSICDATFQSGSSDDENDACDSPTVMLFSPLSSSVPDSLMEERKRLSGHSQYCLVASKQMVGIFLTVWVRSDVRDDVKNLKVSCVGRGLMGYLGNKGSISISMSVHKTTFCFVCSHLTSGQKEGDELRRNSDVEEILRKTRFPPIHGLGNENSPETILDHDRIIWLGDLNYRVALSYRAAKAHVEMHNWRALLENDQFLVLLVEVLKGSFSERYIYEILPVLERILKVGLVISEKHGAVKEKCVNDASHSLQMMEKLLLQFPDLCSEKPFESMWELVVGFLMHPVERLQETSSCLINSYFRTSSKQAYLKEREPSEEVVPSLLQPSRLFTIAASLCCQLEAHPAGLNYTSNIIIENLVVSICGVHSFVKQNHDNNLHQLWSSLAASDHELILKFLEVLGAKTEGSILSSFGNEYPCVDLASLLVLPLLRKLGAAVLQSHDLEQVKMVFGCLSLISTRIGLEGCIKYADPLLLPLYKICEGFAGQVFTDEVKHLAEDLRDRIRGIMGMEEFVRVYDRIRKDVKLKREKRKQVEKLTAVVNPMRSAKRKLKIREKHRSHKKRKLMLMKMGKWNRV